MSSRQVSKEQYDSLVSILRQAGYHEKQEPFPNTTVVFCGFYRDFLNPGRRICHSIDNDGEMMYFVDNDVIEEHQIEWQL